MPRKFRPALNGVGPFSVVNALRPIDDAHVVMVRFAPTQRGGRSETLNLTCAALGTTLRVSLHGEGVSPTLEVDPPDGVVDLGHVCPGFVATRDVTLRNTSVFALEYKLVPVGEAAPLAKNADASAPFVCIPSEASIEPGASKTIVIKFRPDHSRSWAFHKRLRIDVPNDDKRHILTLVAYCDASQMHLIRDLESRISLPASLEDAFELPPSCEQAGLQLRNMLGIPSADVPTATLRFAREDEPKASKSIVIGCAPQTSDALTCVDETYESPYPRPTLASSGTFEVEFDAATRHLFSASPDKGSVPAGGRVTITFHFEPPPTDTRTNGLDVGKWLRTVAKLHFRGAPEPTVQNIVLEGYMATVD